jgi:alpha-L-fucosidase 2
MTKKNFLVLAPLMLILFQLGAKNLPVQSSKNDLVFNNLAKSWDEGMPLGNAVVGSLVWQRGSFLRMSLDHTDLWDLRSMDSISGSNNNFKWVYQQVAKGDYLPVQKKFDHPYDNQPAPAKIPGAALEFNIEKLGNPEQVHLYLNNALCDVKWKNGTRLQTFVHATEPIGWFRIENAGEIGVPELIPPVYGGNGATKDLGPVTGQDLRRLGYEQGTVIKGKNILIYHQKGWGDYWYEVAVCWKKEGTTIVGAWTITTSLSAEKAAEKVKIALAHGIEKDYLSHLAFWSKYWAQSSISIPDSILTKQYANEMYKFGSAARKNSRPISLQAVWTADNGKLPPWKGDYHHDLNTQLSYWHCYTANHLTEGLGYLNTLWSQRMENKRYTKQYFGTEGLNVPGVCTLQGTPMGGWIQYAMSPTVSAWLAQHFYLHYKYSMDPVFLKEIAYPYIKDVVTFLEQFSTVNENGVRKLPLSSSPEIFDNSLQAWFKDMTNYDLGLVRFAFGAAAELATDLHLKDEAKHWTSILNQFQDYDTDSLGGLTFAKGFPYNESHRHFSNSMAIHPLGLIDWSNGEKDQKIIRATIANLEKQGPKYWCGYSYSWFGNIKARAFDGQGAAEALRTFAQCFCLRNTFHANGDQTKTGKSDFTYKPFTLEGNFAFAAGVQEMLLQSHTGIIHIFPAIPKEWKDVSFDRLRTYGAFLVSAEQKDGKVIRVKIFSEKGGLLKLANPFDSSFKITGNKNKLTQNKDIFEIPTNAGQTFMLKRN